MKQDDAVSRATSEAVQQDVQRNTVRKEGERSYRLSRILKDAVERRDEVIRMQSEELREQDAALRNELKLTKAKNAEIDGLRKEDASREDTNTKLEQALEAQKKSLEELEAAIESTKKEVGRCKGRGME